MNPRHEEIADGLEAANIERIAKWRLQASAYAAIQSVSCRFRQGTMVLSGRVPTYFHKQLAQEAIRRLPGVQEIVNNIAVRRPARLEVQRHNKGRGTVRRA